MKVKNKENKRSTTEKISEPQPKKKRQSYDNYNKLKQVEITKWGINYYKEI